MAEAEDVRRPAVSVVIATRDRPELLRRCLRAVLDQQLDVDFEIVVVNDAGCPIDTVIGTDARITLVQGAGRGPAAARNAGIVRASGAVVVFTDDDTIPERGWLQAAVAALNRFPDAVGVVGCVESPPFDPLYEHGVQSDGLGNFLTCNIAYRRAALESAGGFDTHFPYPSAEDRDLGYRMQEIGELRYDPQMIVLHPPRPVGVREVIRRGRFVESEWRLHNKHPQTRPPRWSVRWGPLIRLTRRWQRLLTDEKVIHGSVTRAVRFAVMALGQFFVALTVTLRNPDSSSHGHPPATVKKNPELRVAWTGAAPQRGGGAAGGAWLLMEALARRGCKLDCYASGRHEELRDGVAALPGVRLINFDTGWRSDRWYSKHRTTRLLTGLGCQALGRRRLAALLLEQHRRRPYDVIYQFSATEVVGMRRHLGQLPPLVVHPESHSAGELRWMRQERYLADRCEPLWRRLLVECVLEVRAWRQQRDIHLAARVVAASQSFSDQLVRDYGVDPGRVTVIRNPADLDEFSPVPQGGRTGPWRIAVVSDMSASKGIELVVELSHRLADLEGDVIMELVGAETLWSDYRPLLADLNAGIARYRGWMSRRDLAVVLRQTDILLQPAKYDPCGTAVGQALASGVPVVATDAVGAAEGVSIECCTVVRANDIGALEVAVRAVVKRLRRGDRPAMGLVARSEAERLFCPDAIAAAALTVALTVGQGAASG